MDAAISACDGRPSQSSSSWEMKARTSHGTPLQQNRPEGQSTAPFGQCVAREQREAVDDQSLPQNMWLLLSSGRDPSGERVGERVGFVGLQVPTEGESRKRNRELTAYFEIICHEKSTELKFANFHMKQVSLGWILDEQLRRGIDFCLNEKLSQLSPQNLVTPTNGNGEAKAASTADEVVAEAASTADEIVAKAAFMADEVEAEATSTADEVVAEAASTADEVVAKAAPTADEVVASCPLLA